MVPWPIALFTLFYGVLAALSGTMVWQRVIRAQHGSVIGPLLWLIVSAAAMYGLVWLRPWGRRVAIVGLGGMTLVTLAMAGMVVASGAPVVGLLTAIMSGLYIMAIRYFQRPMVKAWFMAHSTQER